MRRAFVVSFLLAFLCLPASGQKKQTFQKTLDIYWNSKNRKARMVAEAIDFRPGDTVADIGTGNGFFIAALSMFADNLTFFLEDIDSNAWNQPSFDSALHVFSIKSGQNPSNRFNYIVGGKQSTGLPHGTFDKVLIIDTYHHFIHRDEMLRDAISLLKPGGQIVIMEALARRPGDVHHGCGKEIFSYDEIVSRITSNGMKLDRAKFIHKVAGRKNTLFIFSRS